MRDHPPTGFRPLVVVGGSAGSIEPLRELVASLPAGFLAPVCVVIHLPADAKTNLPAILARSGSLDARLVEEGDVLRPGTVYVARPDHHLVVRGDRLATPRHARENGNRPAIDPLFRSAAVSHGRGCVSVLLSGALDDGSAGTAAICAGGGTAIVQDPADCQFPDMPANALRTGCVAQAAPASELGTLLVRVMEDMAMRDRPGAPARAVDDGAVPASDRRYSCPDCGGVMEEGEGGVLKFRCRVGHAYTAQALEAEQAEVVEDALWTALRALEEQAVLSARVGRRARAAGDGPLADRFEARAGNATTRAERLRALLGADEGASTSG